VDIDSDHLTVLAGAGAILDNLMWCIGSAGEAVLIPRPYYPAFDNDLQVRTQQDSPAPNLLNCLGLWDYGIKL
jgi:1-aminocyclopropane-1-carboxylate synthase